MVIFGFDSSQYSPKPESYPLKTNIAMENVPFIVDLLIQNGGFCIAKLLVLPESLFGLFPEIEVPLNHPYNKIINHFGVSPFVWLVVSSPLKNDGVRQLGLFFPI